MSVTKMEADINRLLMDAANRRETSQEDMYAGLALMAADPSLTIPTAIQKAKVNAILDAGKPPAEPETSGADEPDLLDVIAQEMDKLERQVQLLERDKFRKSLDAERLPKLRNRIRGLATPSVKGYAGSAEDLAKEVSELRKEVRRASEMTKEEFDTALARMSADPTLDWNDVRRSVLNA